MEKVRLVMDDDVKNFGEVGDRVRVRFSKYLCVLEV